MVLSWRHVWLQPRWGKQLHEHPPCGNNIKVSEGRIDPILCHARMSILSIVSILVFDFSLAVFNRRGLRCSRVIEGCSIHSQKGRSKQEINSQKKAGETSELASEPRARHCDAPTLRRTSLGVNIFLNGSNQRILIFLPGFKHTWEVGLLAEREQ